MFLSMPSFLGGKAQYFHRKSLTTWRIEIADSSGELGQITDFFNMRKKLVAHSVHRQHWHTYFLFAFVESKKISLKIHDKLWSCSGFDFLRTNYV
jgi:hypothetical protein